MEKNPQNDLVYPGERVDDLQNGLYVIQNPEKFCFGMDAVLLSGFADIRSARAYRRLCDGETKRIVQSSGS